MNHRPGVRTAAVAAVSLLVCGCTAATEIDPLTTAAGEDAPAAIVDRGSLHELLGQGQLRYMHVGNPSDLAELEPIDLALVGEVEGYEPGPDMFPEDRSDKTVIMRVAPTDVFDGAVDGDGVVRVMLTVAFELSLEELESALPHASPTVLYLNTVVSLPPSWEETLWVPVTPQGFITEDQQGSIFPLDPTLDAAEPLAQQVPAGTTLP